MPPVAVLQKNILANMETKWVGDPSPIHSFFKQDHDEQLLSLAFGKLGSKLKAFLQEVDLEHPSIGKAFEGSFGAQSPNAAAMGELYQLAKYAQQSPHIQKTTLYPLLLKLFPRKYYNDINAPSDNLKNIRYLKSRQTRDNLRKKQNLEIGLDKKKQTVLVTWDSHPDSFEMYARYSDLYEVELQKAHAVKDKYRALGMNSMAEIVSQSMDQFLARMTQDYYGFNRCTLFSASIILAKSLGFCLEDDKITAPQTYAHSDLYAPRVYSLSEVVHLAPPNVIKVLEWSEKDYAMFDNYQVLVPSVGETAKDLDLKYIEDNTYMPVVLGEVDNSCYFICYWI